MQIRPSRKKRQVKTRRDERASRTPSEQVARLDAKFGAGVGAKRERGKLQGGGE